MNGERETDDTLILKISLYFSLTAGNDETASHYLAREL
jgi:hypothetical protein